MLGKGMTLTLMTLIFFMKVNTVNAVYTHPLTQEHRKVEYLSGTTIEDFEGYTPDWSHYSQQVVKKAEPIYKAMGWEMSSIRTGKNAIKP